VPGRGLSRSYHLISVKMAGPPYRLDPKFSQREIAENVLRLAEERRRGELFEGRAGNTLWCTCGNCISMDNDMTSHCCKEPSKIRAMCQEGECITEHGSFDVITKNIDVLNITRHKLIMYTACKDTKAKMRCPSNKVWRHLAYKSFVSWVNSWAALGKNRRVVIPCCVVNAIRNTFPEESGVYIGFKAAAGEEPEYFE
jgi:hypothetical protein